MNEGAVQAREIRVRGVVQGVGFRPFVYRLAQRYGLYGWVENGEHGVEIFIEGAAATLADFERALAAEPPPAARIAEIVARAAQPQGFAAFAIRVSRRSERPTVRVSADLPVCEPCLRELFDPSDRRFGYPYINCTDCGPRYSIVLGLPYDRARTTMAPWPLCEPCRAEYEDPLDRRYHAQPVACAACGPNVVLVRGGSRGSGGEGRVRGAAAIAECARLLAGGAIVAIKGIGGYHLACDADDPRAVEALRARKYRKERPFALMAAELAIARGLVELDSAGEALLRSQARPIVLAPALCEFAGVAPDNRELGVMLPYTPLHHLLFAAGAPRVLVMTSANRSSEPIAYEDDDALASLAGIADAFLIGERPIARRIDDSVARALPWGRTVVRRARGMAPEVLARIPAREPILALGGDLKSAIALVVEGQCFASQHIGDLEHYPARAAFERTVADLCAIYEVAPEGLVVAHDAHPEYVSTRFARERWTHTLAVQHHRAHVASVLAERDGWGREVVGFAFDGTGYGDDGTIWGGECFRGSLRGGLVRVAHLRSAPLPGGDAAARFPEQAAAGFLSEVAPALEPGSFGFGERFVRARGLVRSNLRTFTTTSIGRLFDAVAAICGFVREQSFEGQAAMWLEHLASGAAPARRALAPYAFVIDDERLDFRPLLERIVSERLAGRNVGMLARAFHLALADGIVALAERFGAGLPVVAAGGVFQNRLLLHLLHERLGERLWLGERVPPGDGGLCVGQAALAAVARERDAANYEAIASAGGAAFSSSS
ncbi:MAG: carbamoyltransferase HypF [Vulcanimicrobiaceae bacterium]